MKKILLTLGLVGTCVLANAQIKQGAIMVGGELSISTSGGSDKTGGTTVDKDSHFGLTVLPRIGYYVNDHFAVGLGIGYMMTSTTTPANAPLVPNEVKSSDGTFLVGPFARWNMAINDKFGFFIHGAVDMGFGSGTTKSGGVSVDHDGTTSINLGIRPGLLYFVNNRLALEATFGGLSWMTSTSKPSSGDDKHTKNSFDLGLNSGIYSSPLSFGFSWYLRN